MPADEPPVELAQAPQHMDFNVLMRPGHRKRRVGGILMSASPIVMTIALLTSALTINPCGALGDACEDYGHSTGIGQIALFTAFGAALAFFIGLVLLLVGTMQRR